MKEENRYLESIILKSLKNKLTDDESLVLFNWISENEDNIIYYAKIKDVQTLLEIEKIRDKGSKQNGRFKLIMRRLAIVSSAAAVFSFGFFTIMRYTTNYNINPVLVTEAVTDKVVIVSNGETYEIPDSADDKVVAMCSLMKSVKKTMKNSVVEQNEICVPAGKTFKTILEDGTEVHLNANSTLTYPSTFDENRRVVKLSGEAFFSVTKNSKEFVVIIEGSDIKVLGTQFNVHSYLSENVSSVSLVEGSVEVAKSGGDAKVMLVPGKRAVININKAAIEIENFDIEETLAWKNGLFMFDDKPLESVLNDIARWYNVKFEFSFESLKYYKTYLKMKRERPLKELLEAISATNHVVFNVLEDKIVVAPKIDSK